MQQLVHITLNSCDVVAQPRPAAVSDARLRHLAAHGGDMAIIHPDLAGWTVDPVRQGGAAAFSISWRVLAPVVECVVCWDAADAATAWRGLESLYLGLSDRHAAAMAATEAPAMPQKTPWLGVVILPSWVVTPFPAAARWMGDAERCIAWAIIDQATGRAQA